MGGDQTADSPGDPLTRRFVAATTLVVFEHEVPPVEAVFTSIGDDVAVEPHAVLPGWCEEETAPAAVDACDLRVRFQHATSMTRHVASGAWHRMQRS